MRCRLLLPTLLLLAVPATAEAQLPEASKRGVQVSQAGSRVAITFLDTPAGRRAYRPYAGRTVTIRCQAVGDVAFRAGPQGVMTAKGRFRRALLKLRLRGRGNIHPCSFGTVTVATDKPARQFLADLILSDVLTATAGRLARTSAAATKRRLGRVGVVLGNPASTPRRGRIGLYKRNGTLAVVSRSLSGRRIFFEAQGETVRTNVLALLDQFKQSPLPRETRLPSGAIPPAGTPLPDTTDPEITAHRNGDAAVLELSGGAREALRGRRVTLDCLSTTKTLGGATGSATRRTARVPSDGGPTRIPVSSAYHLCSVASGRHFARVALDSTGATALEEGSGTAALARVLRAAGAAPQASPRAQALSDSLGGDVVPLGSAGADPPDLRIGAWVG